MAQFRTTCWGMEMTQQLKTLLGKPEDLHLSPKTHWVERGNQLLKVVLGVLQAYMCGRAHAHMCTHKHTHK